MREGEDSEPADGSAGPGGVDNASLLVLIEGVVHGDQVAFGAFYDALASRVFGLCRRVLISHHLAEEVTQEVFLEVWQRASQFQAQKGSVFAWTMTITHRRAIDRVRAVQSARDRDLKIGSRDWSEDGFGADREAEAHVEERAVRNALTALPEPQRQALVLAYFGGLTQSEIAAQLQVPIGTVKTRMRDGMRRLHGLLEQLR